MIKNFNPGFDREKEAFLELANRGEGLAPIKYLYAKEANFESILSPLITGGTAEIFTLYTNGIDSNNIVNHQDIITQVLKWNNPRNDYHVGFTAGDLSKNTIWTLPIEDGAKGTLLSTNGSGDLSFLSQIDPTNLPTLGAAVFPLPDIYPFNGISVPIPNPTFDPFSGLDWLMSGPWLPQIFAGSVNILNTSSETKISSSLAMASIKTAKNYKLFDNANFIVANKNVSFSWDNPLYWIGNISTQLSWVLDFYKLGTNYTFTKAQSLGELETGLLKNTVDNGTGTLSKAIAGKDYVDLLDPLENMQVALIRPVQQDEDGNDKAKLLARVDKLPEDNMPNLTFIMQRPSEKISNAQGLSDLAPGGILKGNSEGVVSIASGGKVPEINDYVDPLSLQEEITETKAFATAEAAAAEAAATAAGIAYFTEQMLPFSLIPLVPAGASITAAIAAAVFPKENTIDHDADINALNDRINNLNVNLTGDVLGNGLLSSPVITVFTPNPLFTGKEYIKIPVGNIAERPTILVPGMMRFNTSL